MKRQEEITIKLDKYKVMNMLRELRNRRAYLQDTYTKESDPIVKAMLRGDIQTITETIDEIIKQMNKQ